MDFKFKQLVNVGVTHNLSQDLMATLEGRGYRQPFLAIDRFLLDSPLVKEFIAALDQAGYAYTIYDEIVPDPPVELVDAGAKKYKEAGCDCIVAIGGGSVIDAARGINIVQAGGGSIRDYVFDQKLAHYAGGLIAVPTTSGTGSEVSNAVVVTDTDKDEKLTVLEDNTVSEFAILCPELLVTLPKRQTIATGLDVFAHALEAYTSNLSTPVVDAICEKAMFLVVNYLPKAVKNGQDLEARQEMLVASLLGGWVINNGGTQVGHSQAHILGPKYHIPHGEACAYATPGTIQYTATVKPKKIREVGHILGLEIPSHATDFEIGQIVAEAFKHFRDEVLGMAPFSEYGISQEELVANAEAVVNERFAANAPMQVDKKLAEDLLKMFGQP
ncbi:alcohol dehydrogenase [Aerococcus urinaehominis]|uniref:Alcohol dehydrogenase n=1 Tax=Aerococcus urinaehominis TaxID=128944 RepID=A0A109RHB2_9LACT|nr:iron-containing alcohol dehydrogenase [Aerococcus urinaehominis]AMB99909.1 alcohol dehydrogenase [Aerococcus urinaehominis]